ncbi:MAG: hypothetical protein ACREC4_05090 [Methylocella sp.]
MAFMPAAIAISGSSLVAKVLGEMMGLEGFPIALDGVEFLRIFRHPFGRGPGLALGRRGARRLAGVDGSIVAGDGDGRSGRGKRLRRVARRSRLLVMDAIEPFEQGDEIGAAFGLRGHDGKPAGNEAEPAHHGDLLRLAGSFDAQAGSVSPRRG